MTTEQGGPDLDCPQVRVCVGCGQRWHSVRHYASAEVSYCEECELPLLQTLTTTVAKMTSSGDASWVRRFG